MQEAAGPKGEKMEIRKGLQRVVNAYDHKRYTISTILNPFGLHETVVLSAIRFWKPWPTLIGGVTLFRPAQLLEAGMDYERQQTIAEKKHCLFVWVTEVTDRDMIATHRIVANVVRSTQKNTWFQKIADDLIPYLKSVGTFREDPSEERLIRDFAERHTLTGRTRPPAWVQLKKFGQTGDPRDLE
jgi:hypothetical protein